MIDPYVIDCSDYFLPLNPECTTTSTTSSTSTTSTSSTTTTTTTHIPDATTSTTTSSSTSTTTTSSTSTTTTTTTQQPPQTYCLYWDDTYISNRYSLYSNNITLSTSLLGQYVNSRDNIIYGGDTTFYTNSTRLYWMLNRTGWWVEFIVDGITYGPYVYDITFGLSSAAGIGELQVDKSYVVYNPPSDIQLFGTVNFNLTPYYGSLDPAVLLIGKGDGMRIYKADCSENLLEEYSTTTTSSSTSSSTTTTTTTSEPTTTTTTTEEPITTTTTTTMAGCEECEFYFGTTTTTTTIS